MSNHLNFLGISIWVPSHNAPEWDQVSQPGKLYQPSIIATYSAFDFSIGLILYGINLGRREHYWRGRLLIFLSGLLLIFNLIVSSSLTDYKSPLYSFANWFVAIHLYLLEKPYFKRAVREGWQSARWWIPLCLLAPIIFLTVVL